MDNLENKITAAAMRSRGAWEKSKKVLDLKQFTPHNALLFQLIDEFYVRDPDAHAVDSDVLLAKVDQKFKDNDKHKLLYGSHAKEVIALDVSIINLLDLLVETKREEIGRELSIAIINKQNMDKVPELIAQYMDLNLEVLEEAEDIGEEEFHKVTLAEIIEKTLNQGALIKIAPSALNEALDGGCLPGHHIVLFARPEAGKTACAVTMMFGFASQGLDGIYFGNEDPMAQIIQRTMSCMTGMTKQDLAADPKKAQGLLDKRGWERIRFIQLTPGTPRDIEKYVRKYRPKWIVVDQLRNLMVQGAGNKPEQLEEAAKCVRRMAQKYKLLAISITQAGDSGNNKLTLDMGDVDSSNTGIPGQADLMIGIGVNNEYEIAGMRMVALPKNKISGKHFHFPIRINPTISRTDNV